MPEFLAGFVFGAFAGAGLVALFIIGVCAWKLWKMLTKYQEGE